MARGKRKTEAEDNDSKQQPAKQAKNSKESDAEGEEQNGFVASGELVKPATRVRQLKGGDAGKGPVIYWWAALHAFEAAVPKHRFCSSLNHSCLQDVKRPTCT